MEDLRDFMPKSKDVMVGEQKMIVKTLSAAKRDAISRVLFDKLDVINLVKPFMDNIRKTREMTTKMAMAIKSGDVEVAKRIREEVEALSVDVGEIIVQVKAVIQSLLTGDMTLVSCILLDILENRQRAKVNGEIKVGNAGYEYNEQMFAYVRENLTPIQEFQLFKAAAEVNDLLGLAKNYWTLAVSSMSGITAREVQNQEEMAAEKVVTE